MFELFPYLAASLALIAVAAAAFARPEGVLWRAALGASIAVLGAGMAWKFAAAGGDPVLWRVPAALLIVVAAMLLVCAGAVVRHILNGIGAGLLRIQPR